MAKTKAKKRYNIAVIPGDGIGTEVINEGLKVLRETGVDLDYRYYCIGAERYLKTKKLNGEGMIISDKEMDELKNNYDGIYLGAIGDPRVPPGVLEKGIILGLRFGLDQYINLRPVKLYPNVDTPLKDKGPKDIDFVVVRENTEGLYCGAGGFLKKGTPDEVAIQNMISTRKGIERCIRYAFDYAKKRNKDKKVTLCAKTNVLTYACDLWQRTFDEVAKEYPDIKKDYAHVDATCMWMVKNPEWFDVIVTTNMFGDIITDLGAMIQGGMGVAASGNLNPEGVSMFEPIGGSAPKYKGKNVINPLAAIEAGRMMAEYLGEQRVADKIQMGVKHALSKIDSLAAGKMGYSTTGVGDMVADATVKLDIDLSR